MNATRSRAAVVGGDTKKPRKSLSLELKLDILRRIEKGERQVDICNSLSLAGSTVRTILKNKGKIEEYGKLSRPRSSVRFVTNRSPIMVEMERLLGIWIEDQARQNLPVSSSLIQETAKNMYEKLKSESPQTSDAEPFKASTGWFERFKRRANLQISSTGESGGSDEAFARSEANEKCESEVGKDAIELSDGRIMGEWDHGIQSTKIPSHSSETEDSSVRAEDWSICFVKQETDSEKDYEEPIDLEAKSPSLAPENEEPIQRDVCHSEQEPDLEKVDEESFSSELSEHSHNFENEHSMSRRKHGLRQNEPGTEKNGTAFFPEPRIPTTGFGNEKQMLKQKYVRKRERQYIHKRAFSAAETMRLDNDGALDIDEDKLFLLSLLPPLKRLPPDVKSSIKLKFQQIMHEVSYGEIQRSSFYNHSPPCSPYSFRMYSQSPIPEVIMRNSSTSAGKSNRTSPPSSRNLMQ